MKKQAGFTLIELMIVVAIIGILAAIALPAYQTYTNKSKFSEVVAATGAVKSAAEIAVQTEGITNGASFASDTGVIAALSGATGGQYVDDVDVTSAGVIIASSANIGSTSESYMLTPNIANGAVSWSEGGSCQDEGWC